MEVVGHDHIGVKQIRIASIVLKNLLHQYCPSFVAKEWLPINSLGADKVCLPAGPDCFPWRTTHRCPQWLKPHGFVLLMDGLKPAPFTARFVLIMDGLKPVPFN